MRTNEIRTPHTVKRKKVKTMSFDIQSGSSNYGVTATPFTIATGETRFRVSVNAGPVLIFAWDEGLHRYAKYEDTTPMQGHIEMAVANGLQKNIDAMQAAA